MASGKPIPFELRDKITKLIEDHGLNEAAEIIGVARETLARAGSGGAVHRSTANYIRLKLGV